MLETSRSLEAAEAELNSFIERRARKGETDPDELEPSYAESARRHREKIRRKNRARWFAHFCRMAESHAQISEDYERRAEELCEEAR